MTRKLKPGHQGKCWRLYQDTWLADDEHWRCKRANKRRTTGGRHDTCGMGGAWSERSQATLTAQHIGGIGPVPL